MADYRTAGIADRGLTNNNPGNIKDDGTNWTGKVGSDGTFIIFSDTLWGIRAMAVDLTTKINKDGLTNITDIINVYSPPSENNTTAYINAVVADTNFGATETLTADPDTLSQLVRAIIDHEIGDDLSAQYVSDDDITQGVGMGSGGVVALLKTGIAAVATNTDNAALIFAGAILFTGIVIYKATKSGKK